MVTQVPLTEDSKDKIVNWGMPDYSAKYTVSTSSSSPKVATKDCLFVVDNTTVNNNVCIFIDGLCVLNIFASANGASSGFAIVPKGSSYYVTLYNRTGNPVASNQYIVPLKGTK